MSGAGSAPGTPPPQDDPPVRRRRRAVRPGAGEPEPPVDLRSVDDTDLGWEPSAGGHGSQGDDERLRRDVPPHW